LEGLEAMRHFVGNFFDDSYVKLVVDKNRVYSFGKGQERVLDIDPILFNHHVVYILSSFCSAVQFFASFLFQFS